jgi:hypothetical protein
MDVTDQYLAALTSQDVAAAPFEEGVAYVENLERLQLGEGLWKTAESIDPDMGVYVPDPVLQQAGWMGIINSSGEPVLLALRLKLRDGKITEVEHLFTAPAQGITDNLAAIRPDLRAPISEGDRLDRKDLIRLGASYYDALDNNNGALTPFAADCVRIENGVITAGEGAVGSPIANVRGPSIANDCRSQIDSQAFVYIDRIEHRRMIAADPATGLAMGLSQFRHPMDNLPYRVTLSDGSTAERNKANMPFVPFDMPAAHIFKIGPDGKLHEIEAVGVSAPYGSPTGWD